MLAESCRGMEIDKLMVSATNGYAHQSSKESLQGAQKNCFMEALAYPAVEEFTADLEKRKTTNVLHPAVAKTWTGLPPLMTVWTHPRSENAAIQNLKSVKTKSKCITNEANEQNCLRLLDL